MSTVLGDSIPSSLLPYVLGKGWSGLHIAVSLDFNDMKVISDRRALSNLIFVC